jgi:hypothetical protein
VQTEWTRDWALPRATAQLACVSTFKEMMSTCWCALAAAVLAEQTLKREVVVTEGFITYDQVRAAMQQTHSLPIQCDSVCCSMHGCMHVRLLIDPATVHTASSGRSQMRHHAHAIIPPALLSDIARGSASRLATVDRCCTRRCDMLNLRT